MKNYLLCIFGILFCVTLPAQPKPEHNLKFDSLTRRWDEGIPLGNGWLGALIWRKADKLRLSLDRVDLWDDRPMPEINQLKFRWVVEKVKMNQYDSVQKMGDEPYEKYPAPTKIPGAAIEFDLGKLGKVVSNELDIRTGLSVIKFQNGIVFNNYIHALKQTGYFGFENLHQASIIPEMSIPVYVSDQPEMTGNSVEGQGLKSLGYKKGTITRSANSIRYHQPTWNENYYEVLVEWQKFPGNRIIGQWTITNNKQAFLPPLRGGLNKGSEPTGWPAHVNWWNDYWSRSAVSLPDKMLERQYYLDMYKFACVARTNTPPISLQAIWTADNGNLPPWKGDLHHDLNTELSYWPGYTGNHLDLTASFTNWLWKVKEENKRWTKQYFEMGGLNVPGVTTISGKPMGGWIQYSMSPTTAAWLSQHFYWQAAYSMDKKNTERAKDYLMNVYIFLDSYLGKDKVDSNFIRLSSSPEYYDNSIKAWFKEFTNYDKALMFSLRSEIKNLIEIVNGRVSPLFFAIGNLATLKGYSVNETGLTIAPGQNLEESHRHMSPFMAIHPLGLLNVEDPDQKKVIDNSLRWLEKKGTREWCGYSFSWAACLYARAKEGDSAVSMLRKLAGNFCSINTFHLNGDQKGGQYSSFTYRPFTLEGNFASAQGIHELLIQSHKGFIEVFPAVPDNWKDISFKTLRTEGAFLVSAEKKNGVVDEIKILSTAGGIMRLKLPFRTWIVKGADPKKISLNNGIAELQTVKGQFIIFRNGYE